MITVLAVVAVVVAVLALVAGVLALTTLGRLRRGVGLLGRGAGHSRESFIEASARHAEAADRTRAELDALRAWVLTELDVMRAGLAAVGGARQAELEHVVDLERTDRGRHLDLVQQQMEGDFTAIRAEIARLHADLAGETQAERARLAVDNSAARDQLRGAIDKVEKVIATALRRIALVRYDAFDDLGGRLSFSLAVLDSHGDGVTLTSLAGRTETRVYAKPINGGKAGTDLSPEEAEAVAVALSG